jgi:hypothetical protein
MSISGLYIVTLNNEHPISVNAHDPRIAARCIQVSRLNCKVGKAKNLAARERDYWKTFGPENVNFRPIAFTQAFVQAERVVLKLLSQWRVRGKSGRNNEWLVGISAKAVELGALAALRASGIIYALPDGHSQHDAQL